MSASAEELFLSYVKAGLTRDADAQAELFTEDGVFEAPLLPVGHPLPKRLAGRAAIRAGIGAYHERSAGMELRVDYARSKYTFHATADPAVFVAEIDTAIETNAGDRVMSLVHIIRVRDGRIALLRDYFAAEELV